MAESDWVSGMEDMWPTLVRSSGDVGLGTRGSTGFAVVADVATS